ncbi:Long-chain-fatty-acid--CoA ligase FadD13 [Halioglobus japonicus]|nr:Long-chain-fatty-acid--CoA ligase FadD13 [Halioglobus japonicus]
MQISSEAGAQAPDLYTLLTELAQQSPDAVAAVDRSFGLRSTYAQLLGRIDSLAAVWHQWGVAPGSRVVWLGQNSARVLEGILACARLGAIFCPLNWRQTTAELEFVLEDIEPALVIWQQQEIGEELQALHDKYSSSKQRWLQHDGEAGQYEDALTPAGAELPASAINPEAPVLMLYTAAFAGKPNGALLSHIAVMAQNVTFTAVRNIDSQARYLNVGPLFHVATLLETMATFQAGGCNVFIRRADAQAICEAIEQESCDGAFLLPPLIEQVIAYSQEHTVNIKSLRALAGSPEWNALITVDDSLWGRFPYGFGQTETFGYASYRALATDGIGSMGKASPVVEICMFDNTGAPLPAGETGEIGVRGATVLKEYWRRPALNQQRRIGDWHLCNDLGRIEADGTLTFIGPKERMIRSGQENIYPVEVELCLATHPAIAEVAVIGVPDPKWDQNVKAIVVLEKSVDVDAPENTEAGIIEFCKQHIASYKKPKHVAFVETLPRSGGAIDYAALDRDFGGGGYPGRDRK